MMHESERKADRILEVLRSSAQMPYIGEPVSQLVHALQAAHFAEQAGASELQTLAALLHDVGHALEGEFEPMEHLGVLHHERHGASFLREMGCSETLCHLVEMHVDAKRYLLLRQAKYGAQLSPASWGTLKHQGGTMNESEALAFESHPLFKPALAVRKWDEMAKKEQLETKDLNAYRLLLVSHLREENPQWN